MFHCLKCYYRTQAKNVRYNAGIQRRLKLLKENHPDLENAAINEGKLENLENGIFDVHSRNEKKRDREDQRVVDYMKIERKFFKKNLLPNLLSWSEKEQIRFLNNSDPTTWSPEKLSESFPATPEIIKKLIKSQWKPMSSNRIIIHDNTVGENWKAIERGILKLPEPLASHIKTFVSRKKVASLIAPDKSLEEAQDGSQISSEFLGIIKSYKNKSFVPSSSKETDSYVNENSRKHRCETYVLNVENSSSLKNKYYTLQELKRELKIVEDNTNEGSDNKSDNLVNESETKVNAELIKSKYPLMLNDNDSKKTDNFLINAEQDEIPLKIRIPQEKKPKSRFHVYKVSNCYYDYQGNFLYRVPGMS